MYSSNQKKSLHTVSPAFPTTLLSPYFYNVFTVLRTSEPLTVLFSRD